MLSREDVWPAMLCLALGLMNPAALAAVTALAGVFPGVWAVSCSADAVALQLCCTGAAVRIMSGGRQ